MQLVRECAAKVGEAGHEKPEIMMHSGYPLLTIATTLMVANFLGAAFAIRRLRP